MCCSSTLRPLGDQHGRLDQRVDQLRRPAQALAGDAQRTELAGEDPSDVKLGDLDHVESGVQDLADALRR